MATTIKHINRIVPRVVGVVYERDEDGVRIIHPDTNKPIIKETVYGAEHRVGWAEVSRSGSLLSEIFPDKTQAISAKIKRRGAQQQKHKQTVARNLLAVGIYNLGPAERPLTPDAERRGREWCNLHGVDYNAIRKEGMFSFSRRH